MGSVSDLAYFNTAKISVEPENYKSPAHVSSVTLPFLKMMTLYGPKHADVQRYTNRIQSNDQVAYLIYFCNYFFFLHFRRLYETRKALLRN